VKLDRRWVVIFLAGIVALISIGASASVSLSGGCTSIIEGSDSVRGISTPDGTDITATGSIRAAINAAPPGATVSLLPKTYNEIVEISKSLDIIGAGESRTIVDGQQKGSVFTIPSGVTATLADMTIQNGEAQFGGGINNAGTLTVKDGEIIGNTASAKGAEWISADGGGIYNTGTATITNCLILKNDAITSGSLVDAKGGGIMNTGTTTITDSEISGNTASANGGEWISAYGGGIYNKGTATIIGSSILGNTASANDGKYLYATGGGIYNGGTSEIKDSIISANYASCSGGMVTGSMVANGGGIYSDDTVIISGSSILGNIASANDGEWLVATGGGIYNGGTAIISGSSISGNTAMVSDGNVSEQANGGGIMSFGTELTITDSIVSGNKAWADYGKYVAQAMGGGISSDSRDTFSDSTISGNEAYAEGAYASALGGGILSANWLGSTEIKGCVISGNIASAISSVGSASIYGGGIYWNLRPVIDSKTVITGNSEPQIYPY
jgi:hypothetical protein